MTSSTSNMDELHHDATLPSPKRTPALSPMFEGVVPSYDGVLTLELELQMKAGPPKKKRF
jgi:hypothetical protein